MDEYDPYGIIGANLWLQPCEDVISDLELIFSNSDGKKWFAKDSALVFSSRIWGARYGQGRCRKENKGSDLKCSRDGLKTLLQNRKKSLIILVKARKYHEHKETDHRIINKSAAMIIESDGEIKVVQKIPKAIRVAADKMRLHLRCDIMDCYEMVLKYV